MIWLLIIRYLIIQYLNLNASLYDTLFLCFLLFVSRPTISLHSLLKVRLYVIGCINHDIVVSLCSELLKKLFYYIHHRIWYSFLSHTGFEPGSFDWESSTLPKTRVNANCYLIFTVSDKKGALSLHFVAASVCKTQIPARHLCSLQSNAGYNKIWQISWQRNLKTTRYLVTINVSRFELWTTKEQGESKKLKTLITIF